MTRQITHDIIARITHPEWAEKKARLLIADTGEAAVFTSKAAPVRTFTFEDLNVNKGVIFLEGGGEVRFRRVGSSCSWALAKCQVKSLASFWPEAPVLVPSQPDSSPEPDSEPPSTGEDVVSTSEATA